MKSSEKKQKLVEELAGLHEKLDIGRLYGFPNQKDTQQWLADVASVLKNLDESDYQEFIRLSKTVGLSDSRKERKKAAQEINQFLGRKVAEWKRYNFSDLDKKEGLKKDRKFEYWNVVNPFWLIWKLLVFVWKHKLITAIITIIGLLGIDYSLAWKNTLWLMNMVKGFVVK